MLQQPMFFAMYRQNNPESAEVYSRDLFAFQPECAVEDANYWSISDLLVSSWPEESSGLTCSSAAGVRASSLAFSQ